MGSIQLTCFKLPAPTLCFKLPKCEEQVNFFIWYVMRNFFQKRIEVESLFGIHIPPFLGACRRIHAGCDAAPCAPRVAPSGRWQGARRQSSGGNRRDFLRYFGDATESIVDGERQRLRPELAASLRVAAAAGRLRCCGSSTMLSTASPRCRALHTARCRPQRRPRGFPAARTVPDTHKG